MSERTISFQNIIDAQGFEIAGAGMSIVFVALAAVSLFIALLPRILTIVNPILPPAHLHTKPKERPAARPADAQSAEVAAAIAFAVHHHKGGGSQ